MPPAEDARQWIVRGRVQGVGFRWFAMRRAEELGLAGWVRNMEDGAVEVVAAGSEAALDEFEQELRRGPRGAQVSHLESTRIQHELVDAKSFNIKH